MILKSLFRARDKLNRGRSKYVEDQEKPFLEHLEDLRSMLVKMLVTIIISMIACFMFSTQLLDLMRYPVKLAGLAEGEAFVLPDAFDREQWRKAEAIVEAAMTGDPAYRSDYIAAVTDEDDERDEDAPSLRSLVEAYSIFKMAVTLDPDRRARFIEGASRGREDVFENTQILLAQNPNADPKGERSLIKMSTLQPAESFTLAIKVSLYSGLVLCFPFLLYFLAEFVLPGLHTHEKKLLAPSLAVGFGLFLLGVFFAYTVVTPRALEFFNDFGLKHGLENDWRIGYYISFVTNLVLLFGLCFELPVVVMALVKLELLTYKMMSTTRAYAIVVIYVVAALITPTVDILTLNLLAIPMIVLYEICIWLAYFIERKQRKLDELERAERARLHAERAAAAAAAGTPLDDHDDPDHEDDEDDDPEHRSTPTGADAPYPGYEHETPYHDPYHDEHGNYLGPREDVIEESEHEPHGDDKLQDDEPHGDDEPGAPHGDDQPDGPQGDDTKPAESSDPDENEDGEDAEPKR